jgi:uncharacterized membrane protein YgcG
MRITIALLLAVMGLIAADYPHPTGHVNDFAGALPEPDRQILEDKLRAYEQSTSIEVAVAIVPSLQGLSVEDYAREMFQAWGIGKRDKNNGVLFLWAPVERKVRIQVGYGLESALTDRAAAEIVREVTALFRQQEFAMGVSAGVNGILDRLDHGGSGSTIPVAALVAGLALLIGVVVMLQFRRHKTRELVHTLPGTLESCGREVEQAGAGYTKALAEMAALRQEAPQEVWTGLDAGLAEAPAKLAGLRQDLGRLSTHPRQQYRELRQVERTVRKWRGALARITAAFAGIATALGSFRDSKRSAEEWMTGLPGSIARCMDGDVRLMDAARATYAKAREASVAAPVNWLLVYDLLLDAQDCLDRAQGLARGDRPGARLRTGRRWFGSELDSPAIVVIDTMFPVQTDASGSSGMDSGSSSGGSDFGGFGGGDTGSGGASGDY